MRTVFLGSPAPAVPFLDALVEHGHDVALVVTQPDRPVGRSSAPNPTAVKRHALGLGLEVVTPRRIKRREFVESLSATGAELLVVVAYGRILPRSVLESVPRGAVNVHFSLLPKYRGAAPVQWCLARGERTTGVSTMQLDLGMDTGDVLGRREVPIAPGEHAPALTSRLVDVGRELLVDTISALERGDVAPEPQDPTQATQAPLLTRADGEPRPDLEARDIEGRVRGFDPWPGVWMDRGGERLRIRRARASARVVDASPGTIVARHGEVLLLACGGGSVLEISEVQPEGKRAMTAVDAMNGRILVPGDRLEQVVGER